MKKDKWLLNIWENYFISVGISLIVAGAILIFTHPAGIFWAGVIIFVVGLIVSRIKYNGENKK